MPVSSVVSADGSCCTWALPAATAEKREGKDKGCQRSPAPMALLGEKSLEGAAGREYQSGMDGDT